LKFYKIITRLLPVIFIFSACKKEQPDDTTPPPDIHAPSKPEFVVVSYFPSYRNVNEYPDRMFRMCTVVNYAFANLNASDKVTISDPQKFDSVYQKAKLNGAKVFLSISGASSQFASMSASSDGRTVFVNDIMQKVQQYNLDGIDIDWEYPKANDGTSENFTLLMKQLSNSLHVDGKYFLTAAITPGIYAGSIRDGIRNEVFQYVDWFNVMVYDDFSTNPADPYRQHSPYSMAVTSKEYWVDARGMPKDKFVAGIPIYGRPAGITQDGTTLSYKTILQQGGNPLSDSAKVSARGFSDYTIYYNGQPTVKKKAVYAHANGGGIMFWEMGEDASDDRSLIKAACDTLGIRYN
jgi:GH18 family chitinase